MKFRETPIAGAYVIDVELREDERGFFARAWCAEEFAQKGLNASLSQCNISFNASRATLRGLHYQRAPHQECKLVRCTRGSIFDVVVDLRAASPSYGRWFGVTLTADNRSMTYIPDGCAHGFQTLEAASEVFYQMSTPYSPSLSAGIRWNDPTLNVQWPLADPVISEKDRALPFLEGRP